MNCDRARNYEYPCRSETDPAMHPNIAQSAPNNFDDFIHGYGRLTAAQIYEIPPPLLKD
jgi:hypothetical protein